MPYGISESQPDCAAFATVKQEADGSFTTIGCHTTKRDAIDQMIVVSLSEDVEPLGQVDTPDEPDESAMDYEERAPSLVAPEFMAESAERGLRLHEQGLSGDGLMPATVRDARRMVEGEPLSEDKWRRIPAWIARHIGDLDAVQGDEITAGLVAMLLWGGGSTRESARRTQAYAERIVAQLDADEERAPAPKKDQVKGSDENPKYVGDNDLLHPDHPKYSDSRTDSLESVMLSQTMSDTIENRWCVTGADDRRIAYTTLDLRQADDGTTLYGYAAVFDSPSEPMPFVEYVRRGAFSKTINDGADVRLLIDHEGVPLARTKSGTLKLLEDNRGLAVAADLDPSNPDAARVISAMKRGDLNQMSFAFRTIKDSWSDDRTVRELREVQLFDVSVVTFPAYEQTVAEIRSRLLQTAVAAPTLDDKSTSVSVRRAQIALARSKS